MSFFNFDFLTQWISQNPDWALTIVFSIAFIESLAVLGLLMPGWLLLVGVGVLIGTGSINFYFASLSCFIGAILGEYVSFLIGQHYRDQVRHWKIFKRHPDWLSNTDIFFEKYGVASIALGRFVGPVRAFVPLIAGMSSMPILRFQLTNVLSAAAWAPLYLMPGVLLGASVQIDETYRWLILVNIVVMVITAWMLITVVIKKTRDQQIKNAVVKLFILIFVLITSLIYLLNGPHFLEFKQLLTLFWKIINSH